MLDAIFSRARLILVALVFILLTGTLSYISIPKENNPDISVPILYVSVSLDQISPEDAEKMLVRPIESELSSVSGVKKMTASSYQGGGFVLLEFNAGHDLKKALRDVEKAVDKVKKDLPSEAKDPTVSEVNVNDDPVIIATISGQASDRVLLETARQLKKAYRGVPEVLDVIITGEKEEVVEIILKPEVLELYNITAQQVTSVFRNANRLITAGSQSNKETGLFNIKVPGTFETIEDILNLPIVTHGDQNVRVRDIATYAVKYKEESIRSRINGNRSISIEITKRTGENLLNTIAKIKYITEKAKLQVPKNIELGLSYDSSQEIKAMLTDLQNSILSAIALIMIIIVGALGLRSGILVGISIPASFLAGILIINSLGLSLNVVVLFGLILAVGMLVDGTIVVVEYAERKRSEGVQTEESYKMAIRKMGMPIISSTATTLAAFLPLLFWPGVVGKFMLYVPLTLICVLSVSMVVALIIIPVLGTHFKKFFTISIRVLIPLLMANIFSDLGTLGTVVGFIIGIVVGHVSANKYHHYQSSTQKEPCVESTIISKSPISEFYKLTGMNKTYFNILKYVLKRPAKILISSAIMLVLSWGLYLNFGKGVEFFPDGEPSVFTVKIHSPGNLSIQEKDALVREVEEIAFMQNALMGEFKSIQVNSGDVGSSRSSRNDQIGVIYIELKDWTERRKYIVIKDELLAKMSVVKGIELRATKPQSGPRSSKPININVSGNNRSDIVKSVKNIILTMNEMQLFLEIDSTVSSNNIDFSFTPNRLKAATYGVDIGILGQTIRLVTTGIKASTFRPEYTEEEVDVMIRYPSKYRTLSGIEELRVITAKGAIPLSEMITRKAILQTSTLKRKDSSASHKIDANVRQGTIANNALNALLSRIEEKGDLVKGTEIILSGDKKSQKESMQFLVKAFSIAIILMAGILLLQFNSFYSMALILLAVILSTVGVMLGLLISGKAFSVVMSGVGIIALAGIVVNNNIVLISTFDELKKTEKSIYDATIRTAVSRLRPVLLTSITTGLGLLPTALGISINFIERDVTIGAPSVLMWELLSQNILFGLIFASILTLVVTPCALYIFHNRKSSAGIISNT